MSKYTAEYFIAKFEKIPEENWVTGIFREESTGRCCSLGHCGWYGEPGASIEINQNEEAFSLVRLFQLSAFPHPVIINDSKLYIKGFRIFDQLGDSAKERIINALTLIACGLDKKACLYET